MTAQVEQMFYRGETPWHGLGNRIIEIPTIEEAIAAAGLDWQVELKQLYTKDGIEAPGKATVRSSDNSILGVVGSRYTPLQNKDAFKWFQPFLDQQFVELETAGSLADGKRVWILAKIKGDDLVVVGDDIIRKYILLSNSHDGTTAVRLGFTPVRVVCANTEAYAIGHAESRLLRVRHSASAVQNLDNIRGIMNLANQEFEATTEQYRFLASKEISYSDLKKYVKIVLGHSQTEDKDLSTRAKNQIEKVISLFEYGKGNQMKDVKGTYWAAYNGVTEYLSHEAGANADKRYQSLWFGANAQKNKFALDQATEFAKAA